MSRLFAGLGSEFGKVFTTRLWWILAIILFAYIGLTAGGFGSFLGALATGKIASAGESAADGGSAYVEAFGSLPPLIYSLASSVGYVFPVLFCALLSTGEFRHQTITPTFLANPKRGQVLLTKVVSAFVIGAMFGAIALVAAVGLGAGALEVMGVDSALGDTDTWLLIGRILLALALWGVIGVGLGVLIPNQTATIVVVLAFTQFVEPLLRMAASVSDVTAQIGQYLPGSASDALVGASVFTTTTPGAEQLEWWAGGLVLAGYAALVTLLGYATTWRRDAG